MIDRRLYAGEVARALPRILALADRNPLSPTYGCFDRSYWHYRTMDFPSGMYQEFVLPLALAHEHAFPGNPCAGRPRIRDLCLAGVDFARRSAHRDGSCDDYYPNERALGAVVFSLYAMAESLLLLGARDSDLAAFLAKRAWWAAEQGETGVLSNHHAIAALAIHVAALVAGDAGLEAAALRKTRDVLELQHPEGWFPEYEGCDPGYLTVTIDFLARLRERIRARGGHDDLAGALTAALRRAARFLANVAPPDGSLGGEFASRNTYLFMPHGLELLAPEEPAARHLADLCLRGLAAGTGARLEDDRLAAHPVYSYIFAFLHAAPREAPAAIAPQGGRTVLPGAGFVVDRRGDRVLIGSLRKAGAFKYWSGGRLVASDSGVAARLEDGTTVTAAAAPTATHREAGDTITVEGPLHVAGRALMTPAKLLVFRTITLLLGRAGRNVVRRLLQRKLIVGRRPSRLAFTRRFVFSDAGLVVHDEIRRTGGPRVSRLLLGTTEAPIYVAMSQPYQEAFLLPVTDLAPLVESLNTTGRASHERHLR